MGDFMKLVQAGIQAYEAQAPDLAADFLRRAIAEIDPETGRSRQLPWSSDPNDGDRNLEWNVRARRFLQRFLDAPAGTLTESEAREWSKLVFPEQPRAVGPAFYRPGFLESFTDEDGARVRLTEKGRAAASAFARRLATEQSWS